MALVLFFSLIYGVSFLVLLLACMPFYFHFLLASFVIIHAIYFMRRYVFYCHPSSVERLWCDGNNARDWKIQYRHAGIFSAELIEFVIVSRYLMFLGFRVPKRARPIMALPFIALPLAFDSEKIENIRLLRRLLLQKGI